MNGISSYERFVVSPEFSDVDMPGHILGYLQLTSVLRTKFIEGGPFTV
jgi:hypothetical protein